MFIIYRIQTKLHFTFLRKSEDLADPQTKLTPHQIADVQRSWENIRSGRNAVVSFLFIRLFKETPRVQKYFAKFAGVPVDALTGNAEFNKRQIRTSPACWLTVWVLRVSLPVIWTRGEVLWPCSLTALLPDLKSTSFVIKCGNLDLKVFALIGFVIL